MQNRLAGSSSINRARPFAAKMRFVNKEPKVFEEANAGRMHIDE
jgi:hypothetical protein